MKRRNSLFLLGCVLLIVVVSGCRSRRVAQKPIEDMSAYTVGEVLRQQPAFSTMNIAKMEAVATYGMHQVAFRAMARLFADSLLQLSIQPVLGVEMFRMDFTPDGFRIVDKWNRRYTENTYDFLRYKSGVDVSFELLQHIVSNHLFLLDKAVEPNDFIIEKNEGEPTRLVHLAQGMIQRFELVEPTVIAKAEVLTEQARVTCTYADHRMCGAVRFPSEFTMDVAAGNKKLSLSCSVQKIEFNKPMEGFRPLPLEQYEKVTFSKIIP